MNTPPRTAVILVSIFLAASISGVGTYAYLRQQQVETTQNLKLQISTLQAKVQAIALIVPLATAQPLQPSIRGSVRKISTDLGLISKVDMDANYQVGVLYYSAGRYTTGSYADYKRIIAIRPATDPGGPTYYQFATKDDQTYVVDGDPALVTSEQKDSPANPYYYLNSKIVTDVQRLPSDFQSAIFLKDHVGLMRYDGYKNDGTLSLYEDFVSNSLITDFSTLTKLSVPNIPLTFYAAPAPHSQQPNDPFNAYVSGSTKIIAVDASGLATTYMYATKNTIEEYPAKVAAHAVLLKAYLHSQKEEQYPAGPQFPGLDLSSSNITGANSYAFYKEYSRALPHACAAEPSTITVKNVADSDLVSLGVYNGQTIYGLNNPLHPLLKLAYDTKIAPISDTTQFEQVNPGKIKPTLAQYSAKNPLIFMKDQWGRLVVLEEFDYNLRGGCGKPVVYLYPPAPTNVSVNFLSPMQLTTSIPTYHNDWNVSAQPDGTLTDLQPQFTDCSALDTSKLGSEYATSACLTKKYPYLYWAGNSLQQQYPEVKGGWIVDASSLERVLTQKLDQVGLTPKERNDMMEYWLPELGSKHAPYYRLSFLQTADMNRLAPMRITPNPDSLLRIFLDWAPLQVKPTESLVPQELKTFNRQGFAVVEWGGLKR